MKLLAITFPVLLSILVPEVVHAKKVRLASPEERIEYIRRADVWLKPAWISDDFRFSDDLDVFGGPQPSGTDTYINSDTVYCRMNEKQAVKPFSSGKTQKFFCDLLTLDSNSQSYYSIMKDEGKAREIKVKYHEPRGEIPSELIGTRFLWALGFAADHMYWVDKVFCFNCPDNPFVNRGLDPATYTTPRLFSPVAIESKFPGEEINITEENAKEPAFIAAKQGTREGWGYSELKHVAKGDKEKRFKQRVERDALRLITTFIQHSDNKKANQRLVCRGEVTDDGKCLGQIVLMLQDLGATFGEGREQLWKMSRVDYKGWKNQPVWSDPERCAAHLGINYDTLIMSIPKISEEGRQFFLRLLEGFSAGEAGRQRVLDLFRAGRVERRGHTAEEWADVFYNKLEQLKYPMGRENPDFKCPRRIKK